MLRLKLTKSSSHTKKQVSSGSFHRNRAASRSCFRTWTNIGLAWPSFHRKPAHFYAKNCSYFAMSKEWNGRRKCRRWLRLPLLPIVSAQPATRFGCLNLSPMILPDNLQVWQVVNVLIWPSVELLRSKSHVFCNFPLSLLSIVIRYSSDTSCLWVYEDETGGGICPRAQ